MPPSYQENPGKKYPVAYMLDGQNLFNESLSYSYEWQVDETITQGNLDIIVVGIANGPERWQEYSPWDTVDFMGKQISAKGTDTIVFIKEQLKPYIDKHYRTLKEDKHTGLMGSSLGGLMAIYAAIEHSETFGRVAAFSPSFSFSSVDAQRTLDPEQSNLLKAIKQSSPDPESKIYFDVGEVEYGDFSLINRLNQSLLSAGYSKRQLQLVEDRLGRHCEMDWAKRLPGAFRWLFDIEN